MKAKKYMLSALLGGLAITAMSAGALAGGGEQGEYVAPEEITHASDYSIANVEYNRDTSDVDWIVYAYDKHHNPLTEYHDFADDAENYETAYTNTYDQAGRLTHVRTSDGWVDCYYSYDDASGHVIKKDADCEYEYDADGKLLKRAEEFSDGSGSRKVYTYNEKGDVSLIQNYSKNIFNGLYELSDKDEYTYEYNKHNDAVSETMRRYTYHQDSETWELLYTNAREFEYTYENGGKTSTCVYRIQDGKRIADKKYVYDSNGNANEVYVGKTYEDKVEWEKVVSSVTYVKTSELDKLSFTDVPVSAWYTPYVQYASANGLMNGTGSAQFAPNLSLSRAMFAQILYNRAGRPTVSGAPKFTDVSKDQWYYDAVQWANEQGIVSGMGDGIFAPNANVTREQMAVMLYNAQGAPESNASLSKFADTEAVSHWAVNAVKWAVQEKVINGLSENGKLYINPTGSATRAESATMMTNYTRNFS